MTAKDVPHDGAEQGSGGFDYNKITSLSADGCARPGGRNNYTPPAAKEADDAAGFDGYDDRGGADVAGNAPQQFTDTGFDGFDDDAKGPTTISLIGGTEDGGDGDDRPLPSPGPNTTDVDSTVARIIDDQVKGRYVAFNSAGTEMGWLGYRMENGVLVIWTTRTEPAFRGRGVADALTRHVMETAVANQNPVQPDCWYASEWIQKNPKFTRYVTDPGF